MRRIITVLALVMCVAVTARAGVDGGLFNIARFEAKLLHMKPTLPSPGFLGEEWQFGAEIGGHINEYDVGYARFGFNPSAKSLVFGDVGFYSPEVGDSDLTLQLGGMYEVLDMDPFGVALRAGLGYPMVDNADLYFLQGDVACFANCTRVRGLSGWLAVGAGYFDAEIDAGPSDSGTELVVSGGVDFEFLPGVTVGVEAEYIDDPLYGLKLRYQF